MPNAARRALCAIATAIALMLAGMATAQDFPALYDVTGVSANDVLNIRAEPDARSAILSAYAPNRRGVEVIAREGNWGQVNIEGGTGWASLRYLERRGDVTEAERITCFGTEPFWRLDLSPGASALYTPMEGTAQAFAASPLRPARGLRGIHGLSAEDGAQQFHVVLRSQSCNDGMSDRLFGLAAGIVFAGPRDDVLAGCCSIAPQ